MDETPTQAVVASSRPAPATLTTSTGMTVVVSVLSPVEQFRFKKVIGSFITNPGYMLDAMMAASVRSIDGIPMAFPQMESHIETILDKLGWDGWQSVQAHYAKMAEDNTGKVDEAKN